MPKKSSKRRKRTTPREKSPPAPEPAPRDITVHVPAPPAIGLPLPEVAALDPERAEKLADMLAALLKAAGHPERASGPLAADERATWDAGQVLARAAHLLPPTLRDAVSAIVRLYLGRAESKSDGNISFQWVHAVALESALRRRAAEKRIESAQDQDSERESRGRHADHAKDFAWIVGGGKRYDIKTRGQRDIIRALYPTWVQGGDGAPMTESAILGALSERMERLRVERRFRDSPAFGTILRPVEGMKDAWALHLSAKAHR